MVIVITVKLVSRKYTSVPGARELNAKIALKPFILKNYKIFYELLRSIYQRLRNII